MNPSETVWMLAYFRQVYAGRVETTADGTPYVVALTGEALCVEDLHLAWSRDGLHWTALNGNRPTLPTPAGARHTRDPFVRRGPDGLFHLLATGGAAPTDVLYGRSPDLVAWEDLRSIPLVGGVSGARNAWAPEWVRDDEQGNYFVYWSTSHGAHGWDDSRIWCARTPDFRTFTAPFVLFDPGFTVIDATLYLHQGVWHMVFKDERFGATHGEHRYLQVATADALDGPFQIATGPATASITEGPALLPLTSDGPFYLMYDWCMANDYGVSVSDDLRRWRVVPDVSFPPGARHGSVFPITQEELSRLRAHFSD